MQVAGGGWQAVQHLVTAGRPAAQLAEGAWRSGAHSAAGPTFKELVKRAWQELDEAQKAADAAAQRLAAGEDVELHHVMLASERASLSLQLAVAIQSKLVEAYRDISRMQL